MIFFHLNLSANVVNFKILQIRCINPTGVFGSLQTPPCLLTSLKLQKYSGNRSVNLDMHYLYPPLFRYLK